MSISVAVGMLIIALITTDSVAQTGKSLTTGKKGFYNFTVIIFKVIIIGISIPLMLLLHIGVNETDADLTKKSIARNILICVIIFNGLMFGNFYKATLLSSLVAREYEKPIDTTKDLLESGLTFYYPARTAIGNALLTHPKEEIKQIMKNQADVYQFFGVIPMWAREM